MEETNTPKEVSAPKTNNKMVYVIGAVILIGILGFGFINSGKSTTGTKNSAVNEDSAKDFEEVPLNDSANSESTAGGEIAGDVQVISVEAGSFYYKPNVITIKKGAKVKIEMKSVDMMHNFNIDELGVSIPIIKSGNTGIVEFTAEKTGEFEFYCSVGQHRKNGQVGKLIVIE